MTLIDKDIIAKKRNGRQSKNTILKWFFFLCTMFGLMVLIMLFFDTLMYGWSRLNLDFLTSFNSSRFEQACFFLVIIGSVWLLFFSAQLSIIFIICYVLY